MADYDQAAFAWNQATKAMPQPDFFRDELRIVGTDAANLPGLNPALVNAFTGLIGGGVDVIQSGMPIVG